METFPSLSSPPPYASHSHTRHWGKDVSAGNKNQGFTHVLESTFESMEGVAEYIAHPAHVDTQRCSCLVKYLVTDYKPTTVHFGLEG
ncbi:stress-response a/b barrel domain-containing protein hs1 [Quercus suber]|uniref:Stress-response a/b barrel domain-containing protein hs1 n=1 Tax=Quercus suber TaxID=58331 RepID=A0AAW0M198_QUESU